MQKSLIFLVQKLNNLCVDIFSVFSYTKYMDKFTKLMQVVAIVLAPIVVFMALTEPTPNYLKASFFALVGLMNLAFYYNEK